MTFRFPQVQVGEWQRMNRSVMPTSFVLGDGRRVHQLGSGRLVMLGGWAPTAVFDYGSDGMHAITNEVWISDDEGLTWSLGCSKVWDNTTRFAPQHCALSCVRNGDVYVIGSEPDSPGGINTDVWKSSNGTSWTKVTATDPAPTAYRIRAMCGVLNGDIYIMGGYITYPSATPSKEVWRSTDGGVTWDQLADADWDAREMVLSLAEHNGKLYVVGGAQYESPSPEYNDVWSFDGTDWTEVLADGHSQFEKSRFHNVLSLGGRLWIIGGYNLSQNNDLNRVLCSEDNGATWTEVFDSGLGPSHAQAACVTSSDRIILVQGSGYFDRTVYSIERSTFEPLSLTLTGNSAPSIAGGTEAYLVGSGFTGATAVSHASSFTVDSDTQIHMWFDDNGGQPGEASLYVTHPTKGISNALLVTYA